MLHARTVVSCKIMLYARTARHCLALSSSPSSAPPPCRLCRECYAPFGSDVAADVINAAQSMASLNTTQCCIYVAAGRWQGRRLHVTIIMRGQVRERVCVIAASAHLSQFNPSVHGRSHEDRSNQPFGCGISTASRMSATASVSVMRGISISDDAHDR